MNLPAIVDHRSQVLVTGGHRAEVRGMSAEDARDYLLDLLDFLIHPEEQEITPLRETYGLTLIEAKLVLALKRARGRTLSKETLMGVIYGTQPEDEWPQLKIIDVFVCKVRRKLTAIGANIHIETDWGQGYRLRAILDEDSADG